eukprot:gene30694-35721_t
MGAELGSLQKPRYFSIHEPREQDPAANALLAKNILQQAQVKKLRDELCDESENNMHIPFSSFVERALSNGAAGSEAEAVTLCEALQRSGLVLRHNDTVYIQVDDLIDGVTEMLPGPCPDTEAKLAKIDEELAEINSHMRTASSRAEVLTNVMLGTGFIILFTQFIGFIYLTWWELSWDVMEPFGYIISLFYSLVAYAYFMITRGAVFDAAPFREFWMGKLRKSTTDAMMLDEDRYRYLMKMKARMKRQVGHRPFRI